jgi:transposase
MDGSKRRRRKNDRIDANKLARLGRVDPEWLYPIQHRSREVRQDLVMLRARDALVAARTEIINTTRGLVKSMGTRLPKCSSRSFAKKGEEAVAVEMREALLPLVGLAATLSADIKEYDKKIEELGREKYGHTALLRQVKGVGPITALAYVLTLESPQRFAKSRDVGPYLGLAEAGRLGRERATIRNHSSSAIRNYVNKPARNKEIACTGFNETRWCAKILNLTRIWRGRDQNWIPPKFSGTMHVREQCNAITHGHMHIIIRSHSVRWLR